MGSYGIGVSRLVGAIIDAHNDDKGIYWPESVAPYMFGIVNLRQDDNACRVLSESIYNNLIKSNIEVLYDDRDEGAGIKLAEMDLIGIPWQIRVGPRGLKNGYFELMNRKNGKTIEVNVNEANNIVKNKF